MKHLLALDAGTGSGRAVLFNEKGEQIASASREWTHVSDPNYLGSMTFDMDKNWALIRDCITEVLSQVKGINIASVTTTSMREGIALYDKAQKELWACANVDSRAVDEVKDLRKKDPALEKEIYRLSGQTFALGAVPRLLWLKNHNPEIYAKAEYIVMLSDWLSHHLGAGLSVDPSNGGTTGLFNLKTRLWDREIFSLCGIKDNLHNTPVFESGTIIGEISGRCAGETGLKRGIPIVMGGGDAQLGTVGVGAVREGEVSVFGGSFWQQEANLSSAKYDPSGKLRINFHGITNLWQAETIVFFPGLIIRWFRDALCPDIKKESAAQGVDPYLVLDKMASEIPPGSYSILPIFSDAMDYTHWKHAAPSFLNLSLNPERCNRASLFRSLLENAAIVTRANLEQIAGLTGAYPKEIIFAGGASKSSLWCQIVSDVLQIPVKTKKVKEATALGAAIFAAQGAGIITDIQQEISTFVKDDTVYYPRKENRAVYFDLYERWKEGYSVQRGLSERNITEAMWKAPGE